MQAAIYNSFYFLVPLAVRNSTAPDIVKYQYICEYALSDPEYFQFLCSFAYNETDRNTEIHMYATWQYHILDSLEMAHRELREMLNTYNTEALYTKALVNNILKYDILLHTDPLHFHPFVPPSSSSASPATRGLQMIYNKQVHTQFQYTPPWYRMACSMQIVQDSKFKTILLNVSTKYTDMPGNAELDNAYTLLSGSLYVVGGVDNRLVNRRAVLKLLEIADLKSLFTNPDLLKLYCNPILNILHYLITAADFRHLRADVVTNTPLYNATLDLICDPANAGSAAVWNRFKQIYEENAIPADVFILEHAKHVLRNLIYLLDDLSVSNNKEKKINQLYDEIMEYYYYRKYLITGVYVQLADQFIGSMKNPANPLDLNYTLYYQPLDIYISYTISQ